MQFDEIQALFFQECEEGLSGIESHLAAVRDGACDPEAINTIFRAVHSIKGGAGAFGFEALQAFSHHLETVLDLLRSGEREPTPDLLALLFAAYDLLADHVQAAQAGRDSPADAAMIERLDGVVAKKTPPAPSPRRAPAPSPAPEAIRTPSASIASVPHEEAAAPPADIDLDALLASIESPDLAASADDADAVADSGDWRVVFHPGCGAFDNGGDPLPLLRELISLGGHVVAIDCEALPTLDALAVDECWLGWTCSVPGSVARDDIAAIFDFVAEGTLLVIERAEGGIVAAPAAILPLPEPVIPKAAAPTPAKPASPAPPPVELAPLSPPPAPEPIPPASASIAEAARPATETSVAATTAAPATIRVELEKLDRLVNLVGELVINQAMLAQRLSERGTGQLDELADLEQLTRELQDSAMSIRAQPVKSVFNRVPRIIRELEADTGKRVRLEVAGEMTEVDKTVVERIGDPLTHMIRNAVDHGLESPDERIAAGKPEAGVVRIAAEHRSGRIIISVADDGRGIDRSRVHAKAIERGIVAPDAVLTDEEIENLIFAPGFSTAATVSNISGRGVGMDVVRRNVQALGGRIGISSRLGEGSTFTLTLPLTLAILDGMIVSVGGQTYVVPLANIVESLRPRPGEVRPLGAAEGASLLDVRGTYLPIMSVATMLGIADACHEPADAVLLVVETDAGQAILMVDAIQDQRQVVVKSLEANYAPVSCLSGATVMGDGRVALILDVEALIHRQQSASVLALAA